MERLWFSGYLVVADRRRFKQVLRVLGVQHGLLDVGPGKGLDRLAGIPETERDNLGAVTVYPRHHPRAPVAWRLAVLTAAGRPDVGDVLVNLSGADDTAPLPSDHDSYCPSRARASNSARSRSLLVSAAASANCWRASWWRPSLASKSPRTAGSWTYPGRAGSASTISRPRSAPKAMPTATARFSSTIGDGVRWPSTTYSAATRSQSVAWTELARAWHAAISACTS